METASPARPARPASRVTSVIPEGDPVCAPDSPLRAALRLTEAVARGDCPVFLRGESGTGKEVVARFLHARSGRAAGPFVPVNCAAIPPGLIESELFGHRKGAFTGAHADSPGRFRQADGGTLFLDEIGDMPAEVQTRLLRTLQEKTVCPVGDAREYPVDFRLVCATHRDLRRAIREGRFREDLYYRLDVMGIDLPALRERPMDIPLLLGHFLSGRLPAETAERAVRDLPAACLSLPFPGNVRELRNLAERYCVLREMGGGWAEAAAAGRGSPGDGGGDPGSATALAAVSETLPGRAGKGQIQPAAGSPGRIRNSRLSDVEILHALDACGHHRARASALLGITRRALQYRLAKLVAPNPP